MSEIKKFHVGVKAIIENDNSEILLLKVNTDKFEDSNKMTYWDIPGGRIEVGETAIQTLKREVFEEIGTKQISSIKFLSATISNIEIPISRRESVGLLLMVYQLRIPDDTKIILSSEHTKYQWADLDLAKELLAHKYSAEFTELLVDD